MLGFLKQVFKEFSTDQAGQMSAAFAYIAVFSIGPLLLVLISIAGFIFGEKVAQGQLASQLNGSIGTDAAKSLQDLVASIHKSGSGAIALTIGLAGALLGAAGLANQLQNSFKTIFRVVPDPDAGIKRVIYTKSKNIGLIMLGAITAIASIVVTSLITGLGDRVKDAVGIPAVVLEIINTAASLVVFAGVLYLIYKVLPDVKVPRKLAWRAAAIVSVLFLASKFILGIVISRNGTASAYGAAASLVVLLLWFYYSAQIILLGAEGIKVHALNNNLDFAPKRFNIKRKSLDLNVKKDLRGRAVEGFAKGFKRKRA